LQTNLRLAEKQKANERQFCTTRREIMHRSRILFSLFIIAGGMNCATAQTTLVDCGTSAAVFNTGYDVANKTALTLTPQQQDPRWLVSNWHPASPVAYPDASSTWSKSR